MKYCYWSIARGSIERMALEKCVESARNAGVFKEFHVITDAAIPGCECYDVQDVQLDRRIESLVYLKAAISKLPFDYFVWIDPKTRFASNPVNLVGALGRSPLHVPLQVECKRVAPSTQTSCGWNVGEYRSVLGGAGVSNEIYLSDASFWIAARQAIDAICRIAMEGWQKAGQLGYSQHVALALGYAMHMLCADTRKHSIAARPDLWAPDYRNAVQQIGPNTEWEFEDFTGSLKLLVSPAILYLPGSGSARLQPDKDLAGGMSLEPV